MPAASPLLVSPPHPAMELLARETRVRRGPVPGELDGVAVAEASCLLRGDSFVFRARGGVAMFYRRGEGITLDRPEDADPRDVDLWLNGSVYAAIAAINGLMPLHASAVAHDGRVHAFTGRPGAGKSTLAAALGQEGLPLFCDDTLILDLGDGTGPITCLPGHKRLKLWPEGAALAGAEPREQVARAYPKYFAEPAAGVVGEALPLGELIFLEQGGEARLCPLSPGERISRLQDDHYTSRMFEQASGLARPQRFALLAGIAARVPMRRFVRSFDPNRFEDSRRFLAGHIRATGAG